jgi:hypothetical protein
MSQGNGKAARTPDEIRAEIDRARAQIATSVVDLKREVALKTDWRVWYRRRPAVFLAAVVAFGVILGTRRWGRR